MAPSLPAGVIPIVSYKTPGTNVAAWAASVTTKTWLIFHHEPEGGDFPSGQAFTDQFATESALIRSAGNPLVRVAMAASSYNYRDGGSATDGAYLPDPSLTDRYGVDVYQDPARAGTWPAGGLADYDRFRNWLALVEPTGQLWGLTEYGVTGAGGDQARYDRIAADRDTLRGLAPTAGGLVLWEYWWKDVWQFTDLPTVGLWRGIAANGI